MKYKIVIIILIVMIINVLSVDITTKLPVPRHCNAVSVNGIIGGSRREVFCLNIKNMERVLLINKIELDTHLHVTSNETNGHFLMNDATDLLYKIHDIILLNITSYKTIYVDTNGFNHYSHLRKLFLNKLNIEKIEKSWFNIENRLEYINLDDNLIRNLTRDDFSNYKQLSTISISNNLIDYVENKSFSHLDRLSTLKLNNNLLKTIYLQSTSLKHLEIADNILTKITETQFTKMPSLEILVLGNNQIETIDNNAFDRLSSIKLINLSGNKLTVLNIQLLMGIFRNPYHMHVLNLNNNQIRLINTKIERNTNFAAIEFKPTAYLFLANNSLTEIEPSFIRLFKKLIEINLSWNKITTIKAGTFLNENLEKVLLDYNFIDSIENNAFGVDITTLQLSNNRLKNIEWTQFSYLESLSRLDLSSNEIRSIKFNSNQTSNMKKLNLSSNHLTSFDNKLFMQNPRLYVLDVSNNSLTNFRPRDFLNAKNLESLHINGNKLKNFNKNLFRNLTSIELLDISHNQIEMITINYFNNLPKSLKTIYLNNNLLTFLPEFNRNLKITLKNLKISGNPWQCHCFDYITKILNQYDINYDKFVDDEENYRSYIGKTALCLAIEQKYCIMNRAFVRKYKIDKEFIKLSFVQEYKNYGFDFAFI